jgi:hypothetical protein
MEQNEMVLPRLSFWGRLLGVYFSPTETFSEMGVTLGRGGARITGILLPLMALIILTAAATIVVVDRFPTEKLMSEQVDRMVEEGKLTPEQAEKQREQMAKFAPYTKIVAPIAAVFTVLLMSLIFAGVAKLISMVMGIENQFLPLWAVTIYTILAVSILSTALFLVIVFIKPADEIDMRNPIGSNLAAVISLLGVSGLPKFVETFLTYVDVFYIWKILLFGIGFSAVSVKLKASTSIVVCGVIGLLIAIIAAAWAAVFS